MDILLPGMQIETIFGKATVIVPTKEAYDQPHFQSDLFVKFVDGDEGWISQSTLKNKRDAFKEQKHKLKLARRRALAATRREAILLRQRTNRAKIKAGISTYHGMVPNVRMKITEWETDEFGNLSRMIYAEDNTNDK